MAHLMDIVKKGSTDRSVALRIVDSGDGTPETGVVYNTSGIDLWYRREGAAKTSITEASLSALTDAHSDGGFLHVGDGEYRLDLPDAAFASGANYVDIGGTVTGMIVIGGRVRLVNYDPEDGVRLGLTALPNAAADGAGGLPISDAGGLDLDARLDAAVSSRLAPTTAGRTLDVSTGGEAGVDWANVGGASSTIYFSGTTILGLGGTIISFDALWTKVKNAFKLLLRKDSAAAYDASAVLAEINENLGAGAGAFANSTDSVEAIRDRGDSAWVTGTALDAAGVRSAVGLASANLDTQLSTIESQTDDIGTAGAGLTALPWNAAWDAEVQSEVDDALDSVIADSVAADGSRPSVRQALLMVTRFLMERSVTSTTLTVYKEDGTTVSMTFTLNDATSPTSLTRAS